ncbi:Fc.00g007790.m01.CDS01 [Cosmosporella sp. VM-42]
MDVKSTTARLRRTFQYPTDEDSADSQPEAMDEQEQEDLIEQLAAENAARNAQFRYFLLTLPLLTTLPYLPSLFRPSTTLLSLLSLTSLLSTAYLLHHQAPHESGIAILDAWSKPKTPRPTRPPSEGSISEDEVFVARRQQQERRRRSSFSFEPRRSPLELYLPYLNLGLGVVLALMGWAVGRVANTAVWPGMGYLPLVVYGVVLLAKVVMGSVDPEKELSALRYEYKGA